MSRDFEIKPAVRGQVPLLIGIAGPSGGGKTFSALRLASGMQQLIGGDIFFIDTEARRGLHYADRFKFQHLDFKPPFGPLDYLDAINLCVGKGAKIIVLDSMTHEHSGPGGRMDRSEQYLDEKAGDNEDQRMKLFQASLKEVSSERKKLNNGIIQLGINIIFCYRAHDRVKPVTGKGIVHLGWTPETTSPLLYEMVQCFLLPPGADGKPDFSPETREERALVKNPEQFRGWFKDGQQLNEEIGRKLAEWARGGAGAAPATSKPGPEPASLPAGWAEWGIQERGYNRAGAGLDALRSWWQGLTAAERKANEGNLDEWKGIAAAKPSN